MLERLGAWRDELAAIRRDLHAHPELAFEEERTADVVARTLASYGIEVHRGLAKTGVVGRLTNGASGRAIGLRADMDALPIHEETNLAYRSRNEGKMHACGHDGHTAMLLGAARYLAETKAFDGTIHFIFQPAEEGAGGGRVMVEEGLFDKFPCDTVYGMHNMPGIEAGRFAVRAGPFLASSDTFSLTVEGLGSHGAWPHRSVDPVLVAAHIVLAWQSIVSRNTDPVEAAVLSVTRLGAGDADNVIPSEAMLGGTTRAFTPEVRDMLEARMGALAEAVCLGFGATMRFTYKRGYPALVNTVRETAHCARVAAALVGEERIDANAPPVMGGEDFAFMLREKPGCYILIGNGAGENACMIHNAGYDFNDAILPLGASYWVRLAESLLPPDGA